MIRGVVDRAAIAIVAIVALSLALTPWANEVVTYLGAATGEMYAGPRWPLYGAYVYSPAFAQLIWPLAVLPFSVAWAIWVAAQATALTWAVGPRIAGLLLVIPWWPFAGWPNPVYANLASGNIDLLLGAMVVLALRYPAAWAFVILTKLTPGVGLLWFVVRREWKKLAVATAATASFAAVSFVAAPQLWVEWAGVLRGGTEANLAGYQPINVSIVVRLPLAALLVTWGALTARAWTVPLAAGLAMPQLGYGSYAVGVIACLGVLREALRHHDLLDVRVGRRGRRLRPVVDEVGA